MRAHPEYRKPRRAAEKQKIQELDARIDATSSGAALVRWLRDESRFHSVRVGLHLARRADRAAWKTPAGSLGLITALYVLAQKIGDHCLLTRSLGVVAVAHRELNQTQVARKYMSLAFASAQGCRLCEADILLRSAHLRAYEENITLGLNEALRARKIYEQRNTKNGQGKADVKLGILNGVAGHRDEAAEYFVNALRLLDPLETAHRQAALSNLAVELARGAFSRAGSTLQVIEKVEAGLRGIRGVTSERTRLRWIKAMYCSRVHQFDKARRYLLQCQKEFKELRMPYEYAAVTVDLAGLQYPKAEAISDKLLQNSLEPWLTVTTKTVLKSVLAVAETLAISNQDCEGKLLKALKKARGQLGEGCWLPPSLIVDGLGLQPLESSAEPIGF